MFQTFDSTASPDQGKERVGRSARDFRRARCRWRSGAARRRIPGRVCPGMCRTPRLADGLHGIGRRRPGSERQGRHFRRRALYGPARRTGGPADIRGRRSRCHAAGPVDPVRPDEEHTARHRPLAAYERRGPAPARGAGLGRREARVPCAKSGRRDLDGPPGRSRGRGLRPGRGLRRPGGVGKDQPRSGQAVDKAGATAVVVTDPSSVAWIFNIRGADVPHTPHPLARAIMPATGRPVLFIEDAKLGAAPRAHLSGICDLAVPEILRRRAGGPRRARAPRSCWTRASHHTPSRAS